MKIVIPGGSGQVGTLLARHYHAQGYEVVVLSRSPRTSPWRSVYWDAETCGDWVNELNGADALINLAGRIVNCRYNYKNRCQIWASRTRSVRVLGEAVSRLARPPKVWLQAGTATIYAHSLGQAYDDITGIIGGTEAQAPDKWRFSIDVARAWEGEFELLELPDTRKVVLRSAMVMSPDKDGVFDYLLWLVRMMLGGTAGSGDQYISWIHDEDFIRAVSFLIDHQTISGAVNIASPQPLPNRDFMRELRMAWGTKIGLPAYEWMLEVGAVLLQTESELVLKSRRVVPKRLLDNGFEFRFSEWAAAAKDLCDRVRQRR